MPASFSLVTAVDEDLQCPICFEFALPTVAFATCMHKLCGGCAQHLPAVGGASNDAVACPMCRQVSVLRPDPTFTNLVAKAEANAEYRCDDCSATVKSGERRDHRCGTTDEFESLLCSLREALQVDDPEVRRRIQEEWNRGTRCAADVAVRILDSMEATAQREDGPPPAPRVGTPTRPPAPHRTPPAQLAKAAAQRGAPQKALGLLFTPAMSAKNTTSGQTATSGQNPTLLKKATPDKNTRPVPAATTQPVQPATPVQSTAKPVPTRRQPVASQPVAPAATPRPEAPPATPAQPPAPQRQPFAAPSATSAPPRGVPPRDARTNFAQHIASALAGVADARDFMIDEESAAYASMSMSVTRSYRVIHRHFDSLEEFLSSGGSTDPVHHFENGSTSIFIAGAYMQQSSSVTRIRTVRRTTL